MAVIDHWHPVCRIAALRRKPVAVTIDGRRIAVFRTATGALGAIDEVCPHRHMRLSLGTVCGENGVNIANFQLGRNRPGGDAIALLYLDAPFPEPVLEKVRAHKSIDSAKPLHFDVGAQ